MNQKSRRAGGRSKGFGKRGLMGFFIVFGVILILLVGGLYWFFVRSGEESEKKLSGELEIVPESVFVNEKLSLVLLDISVDESEFDLTDLRVTIIDESEESYFQEFQEALNEFGIQKITLDFSEEDLEKVKEIRIEPKFLDLEGNSLEEIVVEYEIVASDFESLSCNNDGIHDPGEGCDDGNEVNLDDCLNNCNVAYCGDGLTQRKGSNFEECDEGLANSDINPNTCRADCTSPRCGDGVVDDDEECDGGSIGDYGDGINMCSNYSVAYGAGNLKCAECKIDSSTCKEVYRVLELNGINDSVDVSSLELDRTSEFSFSAWAKSIDGNDRQTLIGCSGTHTTLRLLSNSYIFKVVTANSTKKNVTARGVKDGVWNHVVGIHNPSFIKIYLNGEIAESLVSYGELKEDITCRIGAHVDGVNSFFEGRIDDIRMYDKVLTELEVRELFEEGQNADTLRSDLVGRWKFDDGFGTVAKDSSGKVKDGTLEGNPKWIIEDDE